jgi:hypothetical protein
MKSIGKQSWGSAAAALVLCSGMTVAIPGWAQQPMVTVPAGTSILIRMKDTVDSSKNPVGYRFTASLETNLQVGGVIFAPARTTAHGRLAQSKEAGRVGGSSELQLELTDIIIGGSAYPVLSSNYEVKGSSSGKKNSQTRGRWRRFGRGDWRHLGKRWKGCGDRRGGGNYSGCGNKGRKGDRS